MKARIVEEHFFNLEKKLVEHEKGEHFLKLFERTMSIPKDILKKSLYYISDRGDWGEGEEVVRIYFVNPYQGDTADTFFLANIRESYIPKIMYLSKQTESFWSNNIKENVKEVYNIDWMFDFSFNSKSTGVISKDITYSDFIDALYVNIKEEYRIFFNTEYSLPEEKDVRTGKCLNLWIGENKKYQVVSLVDIYFKTKEREYKRISQEQSVYSPGRLKEYF